MMCRGYSAGQMIRGNRVDDQGALQLFTKSEGSSHLQKSNIIVHRFSDGELWVYYDGFNG